MALLITGLWSGGLPLARAQVMDIAPDGSTAIYKGPVVASAEGVRPLASKVRPAQPLLPIAAAIRTAASRHALSQALIAAVAWQESHMRQDAVSPKGARGVMQLMPATARTLQVDGHDLSGNIDGGAAYLARLLDRFDGDVIKTLAAYNAGPEAVERYHGVPPYPETQAYVSAILNRLAESVERDSAEQKGHP
ncbi:MAG TPA: lytic transglycosylase domain-containing protein [Rhizomicrobium sp.]|nr:lytic transglycosylase domain-containing protein [Rhizomicrobium sp.]